MPRDDIQISFKGGDTIYKSFIQIGDSKRSKKIQRAAFRKAAKFIQEAAKRKAPLGPTGNLRDSIKVSVRTKQKGRIMWAEVWIDARIAPHAHIVERGTVERFHKSRGWGSGKRGRYTGRMPAKPFLRPAFDQNRELALSVYTRAFREALEKDAKKHANASKRERVKRV